MAFFNIRKRKFVWQKIRIEISRVVQKILLGVPAGNMAPAWVRSVAGAFFRESMQKHLIKVHALQEPTLAHYSFPKVFPIKFRRNKAFDEVHLYEFEDVIVSPHSGIAYLPEGYVLEESAGPLDKVLNWGKIWPELLLPIQKLDTPGTLLVVPSAPFYHFVWEHLPVLIQTLRLYPDATFLVAPNAPKFVHDYLDLLLGPTSANRFVRHQHLAHVPRLLVPQVESFSGFIHPAYPALLRASYQHLMYADPAQAEAIYISRRFAPGRRMRHEQELEQALAKLGFAILLLEKMPVEAQMRAFWHAKFVVAPHGAGLSHLHMAQPGTTVLEVFPFDYFNDCYARLAVSLGYTYEYVTCKNDPKWEGGMLPVDNVLARVQTYLQTEAAVA